MLLIDNLLLLPVKGFVGIFKRIHEMAEQELSNETYLLERLMALRLQFEMGEMEEREYMKLEKDLLERLNAVREIEE